MRTASLVLKRHHAVTSVLINSSSRSSANKTACDIMDFCALSFYCTTLNSGCLRSQSYSKIIRFPTPVFGLLLCSLSECGWSIQLILQITFASGSVLLMQLIHNINFNHLLVSGHTVDAAWGLWGSGTNQSVSHWPPSHLPTILSPRRGAHIFRKERDKSQAPGLLS